MRGMAEVECDCWTGRSRGGPCAPLLVLQTSLDPYREGLAQFLGGHPEQWEF